MQIELMGCTGAGKSTLAKGIVRACREQGVDIVLGDDLVLGQIGLNGIASPRLRRLLLNLLAVSTGLASWRTHRDVYRFAVRYLMRLPIGPGGRINTFRSVLKRVGIYEIVRRRGADGQIVLVDEGVLQVAHYLFVHVSADPGMRHLSEFARVTPLPDAIVYLKQPQTLLVARTVSRGHKRIPDRSYDAVSRFIGRAVSTFDRLAQLPRIESRLLVVDGGRTVWSANGGEMPALRLARRIVQSGMAHAVAGEAPASTPRGLGPLPGTRW